jgi:2'-5' RNA ligase
MRSVRSFIAIECPEEVKKEIQKIQQEMRMCIESSSRNKGRGINWTRSEGFHLTLKFLGSVAEVQLSKITEAVRGVVGSFSSFTVSVAGVGVFPNIQIPRVLWIGAEGEGDVLARLQTQLEEVLDPLGFCRERRSFHPHFTLGRIKMERRELDFLGLSDILAKWLAENKQRTIGQFEAQEVLLIKSDLQPAGAVYTPLAKLKLGANRSG